MNDLIQKRFWVGLMGLFFTLTMTAQAQFSDTFNFIKELKNGNYEAAREAYSLDVSPNARDADGVPVLSIAVDMRSLEMMTFLLDEGAYVNATSRERGESALMRASAQGLDEAIRLLLERGADLNQQDKGGETPLIKAILGRQRSSARALYDAGANPDIADFKGRSAFDYARESRSRAFRTMFDG